MKKRIGLLNDYIKVKRAGSEETTFGGDQNFFAAAERVKEAAFRKADDEQSNRSEQEAGNASENAEQKLQAEQRFEAEQRLQAEQRFEVEQRLQTEQRNEAEQKLQTEDLKKQKMGCGIVALSDLFLYLSGKYNAGIRIGDRSYVNHGMLQSEYCEYYDRIYAFAGGVSLKAGASGLKLWRKFNRMAKVQGWNERARWGFSRKKIFQRMEGMLLKDIPVILCMPMALFKNDKGICFYKRNEKGEYVPYTRVSGHYVVVTEIIYEEQDIYLVISSWGKQYFVKWNEYDTEIRKRLFGGFLGNILYIR